MKRKIVKITALIVAVMIVLALAGIAKADTVELDLFGIGCQQVYDFDSPPYWWTADFDLGVTFTEISNVYIDWAGEITAGLAQDYDPQTFEPIGEPHPMSVGIYASLGFNPSLRRTEIYGGMDTYPAPESFDQLSEIELIGSSTWSDLLDGQGTIGIGYTEIINANYVQHGSVSLTEATLVVEGVVVPEPASLVLFAIGLPAVRAFTRRKRQGGNIQEEL